MSYFKSVSGSVPCSVCPSNSRTSQEGSTVCECRSGFYRAANDANSSACTSELCWFVCLRLALWEVVKGPHWSFVIYSDCGNPLLVQFKVHFYSSARLNVSASMQLPAYFKLFSRCFHLPLTLCMSKTPPVFSFSLFSPHSSSICASLSVLGV